MQFLSTIFAIIGLVAISLSFWGVRTVILGRVGKPTGLSSFGSSRKRLAGSRFNPSHKVTTEGE